MTQHPTYCNKKADSETCFTFYESTTLPEKLPVSTPLTFSFIGKDVVLCLDKNGWWNPLGGHPEPGESMSETLVREAQEEAGVSIQHIAIVGYVRAVSAQHIPPGPYPAESVLPITISFVQNVDAAWQPLETKARGMFSYKKAQALLRERKDNEQMLRIFEYVYTLIDGPEYAIDFQYSPGIVHAQVPVTQVFTLCRNRENEFCIVKDSDEDFFSLPGGGCDLGELSETCLHRELQEEAQVTCRNIRLLGSVLVRLMRGDECLSAFQHLRYLADLDHVEAFVPNKEGFETDERKFIPLADLVTQVPLLQNPTGQEIVKQVEAIQELNT